MACPTGQAIEQAIRDHGELHCVVFNLYRMLRWHVSFAVDNDPSVDACTRIRSCDMLLTFCPISKGTLHSRPEAARETSLWSSGDSVVDAINEGIVREIADQGKASLHLYLKLLWYTARIPFCPIVEGIECVSSMLVVVHCCSCGRVV